MPQRPRRVRVEPKVHEIPGLFRPAQRLFASYSGHHGPSDHLHPYPETPLDLPLLLRTLVICGSALQQTKSRT